MDYLETPHERIAEPSGVAAEYHLVAKVFYDVAIAYLTDLDVGEDGVVEETNVGIWLAS